jgi:PHD/YefM family antitoxin component YafN of YafNO toxin-antitoxin module
MAIYIPQEEKPMKERTISLTEAQRNLSKLSEQLSADSPSLIVTRNNQPVLAIMSYQAHQAMLANIESLQTLLEIIAGKEAMQAVKTPREPVTSDHSTTWEELQKEIGW